LVTAGSNLAEPFSKGFLFLRNSDAASLLIKLALSPLMSNENNVLSEKSSRGKLKTKKTPKKRLKTPSADGREWADKGPLGIVRLNQPSN